MSLIWTGQTRNDGALYESMKSRGQSQHRLEGFFYRYYPEALGPEHPQVATVLANYADLLRKMNRDSEAEKLEARAQAIRAKHAQENPAK